MNVAAGAKGVDAAARGRLQGITCAGDVLFLDAGQRTNHRPGHGFGNAVHRFVIAGRGNRKSGFDDIDLEARQLFGHFQFFVQVHRRAGTLFAVA